MRVSLSRPAVSNSRPNYSGGIEHPSAMTMIVRNDYAVNKCARRDSNP
jgi:hypothetical protein